MPLVGNSKQNKERSIEDFYLQLKKDNNPFWGKVSDSMLELIGLINELFPQTTIWGLTSHSRLVLQASDKWDSEWFVIIKSLGNEFEFQYLMPHYKSPWEDAFVKGVTRSLSGAKKYLLIAMKESGGWADNHELQQLLVDNDLL